jgi:hypothetical protein
MINKKILKKIQRNTIFTMTYLKQQKNFNLILKIRIITNLNMI